MKMRLGDVQVPQTGRTIGQFIRPGVNELKITDILLKVAVNSTSYSPIFLCETKPITAEGWTGVDGAKGQVAKIAVNQGYYIKNEEQLTKVLGFIKDVAEALGKSDQIADIEFETIPELIEKLKPILADGSYARYFVCAEEYAKQGGGKGLKLFFQNKRGVEALTQSPTTLPVFNENDRYHYKRLSNPNPGLNTTPVVFPSKKVAGVSKEDLPF